MATKTVTSKKPTAKRTASVADKNEALFRAEVAKMTPPATTAKLAKADKAARAKATFSKAALAVLRGGDVETAAKTVLAAAKPTAEAARAANAAADGRAANAAADKPAKAARSVAKAGKAKPAATKPAKSAKPAKASAKPAKAATGELTGVKLAIFKLMQRKAGVSQAEICDKLEWKQCGATVSRVIKAKPEVRKERIDGVLRYFA